MATTEQQTWRVIDILNWSHQDLASRGVDKPRLDAEILLGAALGLTRLQLYTNFDRPTTTDERDRFRAMLQRRRNREPLAYILGRREFYSLDFAVGPSVLVPRPETELLVERAVALLGEGGTAADVGTGSGCVAVALARHRPGVSIWASDLSAEALIVARANGTSHESGVRFVQGDLLAAFPTELVFDVIVSNPPYVATAALAGLEPELGFEPRTALDGGTDGLDVVRRLVEAAPRRLRPGGWLLFEMGADQGPAVRQLLIAQGYQDVTVVQDLAGRDRVAQGRLDG